MPAPKDTAEPSAHPRSIRPPRYLVGLLAGSIALATTLTGCSIVSDAVVGELGTVACAAGSTALQQLGGDVAAAVADLAVDPAATVRALKTVEAALAVAVLGITSEPSATAAENAKATLAEIIVIADDAATNGTVADPAALSSLVEDFTTDITGVC